MRLYRITSFSLVSYFFVTVCLAQDYKISVPDSACDDKKDKEIKITGKDAEKLRFLWSLYFIEGNTLCDNIQRCNLLIWKNVRLLEKKLNKELKQVKENGAIKIDNNLLLPSITYVLNVTVYENVKEIGKNSFIIKCDGSKQKINEVMQSCSVSLKGSNVTYSDMTYILIAEIAACSATNYTLNWEILDGEQKLLRNMEKKKTNFIKIAPKTFRSGNNYAIKCTAVLENGTVLSKAVQTVNVLKRGLYVKLALTKLVIGVKQSFKINSYVDDPDDLSGNAELNWSCTDEKMVKCDNFVNANSTELEIRNGFENPGSYLIQLMVNKSNSQNVTKSAVIIAVKNKISAIEVEPSGYKYNIADNIEIRAVVNDIITGCTLQWVCVTNETGYEPLDIKTVPGNVSNVIKVQTKEDTMLEELTEHSNETIDKEIELIIPPADGNWPGLKGDKEYLFRLIVSCPQILVEEEGASKKEPLVENPDKPIVFYADIPISTTSPPTVNAFNVNPTTGNAFETKFRFESSKAEDKDIPVLYKYGYVDKKNPIFLNSGYETLNADILLPYIKYPVDSILEVCDNTNTCIKKLGPKLTVKLPSNISDEDISKYLQQIEIHINNRNYYNAFINSASLLKYFRDQDDEIKFNNTRIFVENKTNQEITKLLNLDSMDLTWYMEANELVKNIKILANEFNLNENTLQNVVLLRNKISGTEMISTNTTANLPINSRVPIKLSSMPVKTTKLLTIDDVKNYIETSEMIISNSKNATKMDIEKMDLLRRLRSNMAQLCTSLYKYHQVINFGTNTVAFAIRKFHKSQYPTENNIYVDGDNRSATFKLDKQFNDFVENNTMKQLCIGTLVLKDYFNASITYGAELFKSGSDSNVDAKNIITNVVLPAPNVTVNAKCLKWTGGVWDANSCVTEMVKDKQVYCRCNSLGYFSVVYTDEPLNLATSTMPTTKAQTTLTSTMKTIPTIAVEYNSTVTNKNTSLDPPITTSQSNATTLSSNVEILTTLKAISTATPTKATAPKTTTTTTFTNAVTTAKLNPTVEAIISNTSTASSNSISNNNIPSDDVEIIESSKSNNTSEAITESSTTSYVLIGISLTGIALLTVATKKMLLNNEAANLVSIVRPNTISSHEFDTIGWPRYARLHAEENLQDPVEEEE